MRVKKFLVNYWHVLQPRNMQERAAAGWRTFDSTSIE